jgi:hypothetical protein
LRPWDKGNVTADHRQIPVLLIVDAEPSGFFIPRDRPDPWLGFERGFEIMADIRRTLVQRTGRPAHFIWLVRADPQIEEVYGSAAWALEHYRRQFEELEVIADEIGLHVHAYRWDDRSHNWIEDYGNQPWVAHCVRTGFRAFETALRRRPAAFSMGMDWTNQPTLQMAKELGARWDLTAIPGAEPRPLRFSTGTYTGIAPDCTQIPRQPYQPTHTDFRQPASPSADGMWIFPLSSRIAPLALSWKRRLYNRLRFQPIVLRARKFFLTDDPASMRPAIDAALRATASPYLTFAVRTDEFLKRRRIVAIRKNLEHLLAQAPADLVFTTPGEGLRILESAATTRQPVARSA